MKYLATLFLFTFLVYPVHSQDYIQEISGKKDVKSFFKEEVGIKFAKYIATKEKGKIVIKDLYIINPKKFEFHLEFLQSVLHLRMSPKTYTKNLFSSDPEYIVGSLFALPKGKIGFDVITKEQGAVDAKKYAIIQSALGERIKGIRGLVPLIHSTISKNFIAALKANGVKGVQTTSSTFASSRPVVYNAAMTYGYLRIMNSEEAALGEYGPRDILALSDIPLDVGPVSGIITSLPQTPNSHVFLRALELKIPNIYIPKKVFDKVLKGKSGKLIQVEVKRDGKLSIKDENGLPGIDKLADKFFQEKNNSVGADSIKAHIYISGFYNWNSLVSREIENLGKYQYEGNYKKGLPFVYGAKATNFAILDKALNDKLKNRGGFLDSFLIPFSLHRKILRDTLILPPMCDFAIKGCEKRGYKNYCKEIHKKCGVMGKENLNALLKNSFYGRYYKDSIKSLKLVYNPRVTFFTSYERNQALLKFLNTRIGWVKKVKELADFVIIEKRAALLSNPKMRKSYLAYLREIIMASPVPDLDNVIKAMRKNLPLERKWRMRSSTNAEDLPFFTGAGLYSSKAVCVYDTFNNYSGASICRTKNERIKIRVKLGFYKMRKKTKTVKSEIKYLNKKLSKRYAIPENLKNVVASVYNDEAFLFRDHYGIPHSKVFMGILTHPSFDDERANGVAIVTVKPKHREYSISSQRDDILVTNPSISGAIPEEIILKKDFVTKMVSKKIISKSNILIGSRKEVLTNDQFSRVIEEIDIVIDAMEKFYFKGYGKKYDIEYMVSDAGEIIILQIRPIEMGVDKSKQVALKGLEKAIPYRLSSTRHYHAWDQYIISFTNGYVAILKTDNKKGDNEAGFFRAKVMYNVVEFYKDGKKIQREAIDVNSVQAKAGSNLIMSDDWGYCRVIGKKGSLDLKFLASKTFPEKRSDFKNLCKVNVKKPGILCYLNLGKKPLVLNLERIKKPENWDIRRDKDFSKMMSGMPRDIKKMEILDRTSLEITGCLGSEKLGKIGNGFIFDDQFASSKGIYGLGDNLTPEMLKILGKKINSDIRFKKEMDEEGEPGGWGGRFGF